MTVDAASRSTTVGSGTSAAMLGSSAFAAPDGRVVMLARICAAVVWMPWRFFFWIFSHDWTSTV